MRTRRPTLGRLGQGTSYRCVPDERDLARECPAREALIGSDRLRKQVTFLRKQKVR